MISRRRFLARTALAGAALSLGQRPTGAFAATDTLSLALAARAATSLNPQQPGVTGGDNWATFHVFDRLVKAPEGRWAVRPEDFQPSLAASWEVSPDARTWTYRLREGVGFHKGYGTLTADDVAFTFGRHLDPAVVTSGKVSYANIAAVEAADPLTVRFRLKSPDPSFNGSCASQLTASILSRKAFEERGEAFRFDPVGTGPYEVRSVNETDGIVLAGFAGHFAGAPATPNLRISFIADTTARTLAFASGDIDMIEGVRAPGWLGTMRGRSADTVFDMTAPGSINTLHLNLTRPPLDDLRVRQAIRHGIDNATVAAAFAAMATPMVGTMPAQFAGSVRKENLPAALRYDYDPGKAKALLAEAGHPDGVTIPCYTSQREDYASIMLIVQEQLRGAGIDLKLDIIDHATLHANNRNDRNALALNSSSYPPVPTLPILQQLAASAVVKADGSGQGNYSHYGVAIEGIDALMSQADAEPDFDRRIAIVERMEEKILADLPLLGIITLSYVIVRNPRVDLGYAVEAGPAYWSLGKARRVA